MVNMDSKISKCFEKNVSIACSSDNQEEFAKHRWTKSAERTHGAMVSTLDFESSDPSSNPGGTSVL